MCEKFHNSVIKLADTAVRSRYERTRIRAPPETHDQNKREFPARVVLDHLETLGQQAEAATNEQVDLLRWPAFRQPRAVQAESPLSIS